MRRQGQTQEARQVHGLVWVLDRAVQRFQRRAARLERRQYHPPLFTIFRDCFLSICAKLRIYHRLRQSFCASALRLLSAMEQVRSTTRIGSTARSRKRSAGRSAPSPTQWGGVKTGWRCACAAMGTPACMGSGTIWGMCPSLSCASFRDLPIKPQRACIAVFTAMY